MSQASKKLFKQISIPGKTFIAGEYAVLAGGPAILLVAQPMFSLTDRPRTVDLHLESPAARLEALLAPELHPLPRYQLADPYAGEGGFGRSTAEFLALLFQAAEAGSPLASATIKSEWKTWELYRELTKPPAGAGPSGADLLAQMHGMFSPTSDQLVFVDLKSRTIFGRFLTRLPLLLFHTGKKLPTHEHLQKVSVEALPISDLNHLTDEVWRQITQNEGDLSKLGASLDAYSVLLESHGLLADHSRILLRDLRRLPGILGTKGCGAMGSDVIVAVVDLKMRETIVAQAAEMGLKLIRDFWA